MTPSGPITNVLRSTPMYFLPYIDFSTHTPYASAVSWSGSLSSVNGRPYLSRNLTWLFSGSGLTPITPHAGRVVVGLHVAELAGLGGAAGRVVLRVEVEGESWSPRRSGQARPSSRRRPARDEQVRAPGCPASSRRRQSCATLREGSWSPRPSERRGGAALARRGPAGADPRRTRGPRARGDRRRQRRGQLERARRHRHRPPTLRRAPRRSARAVRDAEPEPGAGEPGGARCPGRSAR